MLVIKYQGFILKALLGFALESYRIRRIFCISHTCSAVTVGAHDSDPAKLADILKRLRSI